MGLNLFKGPISLCHIDGFALLPGALLTEFINKDIERKRLVLAQTMPYRRDCLSRGCLIRGSTVVYVRSFHLIYLTNEEEKYDGEAHPSNGHRRLSRRTFTNPDTTNKGCLDKGRGEDEG